MPIIVIDGEAPEQWKLFVSATDFKHQLKKTKKLNNYS